MGNEERKFVEEFMFSTLGRGMEIHCYQKLKDEIFEDVVNDINETSGEDFSDDDIQISVGRILSKRLWGYEV